MVSSPTSMAAASSSSSPSLGPPCSRLGQWSFVRPVARPYSSSSVANNLPVLFPDTFSIWSILYGNVFYLIGGGGQMVVAMLWTIVADVVPVAERTSVFYRIYAMNLLISVAINPIAGWLLSIDPWLATWVGCSVLAVGMLSSALIPETLKLRQEADRKRLGHDVIPSSSTDTECDEGLRKTPGVKELARRAWLSTKDDVSHVWRFIFASKAVVLLLLAYGPFYLIRLAFVLDILQYMTRRFNWEWSTVREPLFNYLRNIKTDSAKQTGNLCQHSQQPNGCLYLAGGVTGSIRHTDQEIRLWPPQPRSIPGSRLHYRLHHRQHPHRPG